MTTEEKTIFCRKHEARALENAGRFWQIQEIIKASMIIQAMYQDRPELRFSGRHTFAQSVDIQYHAMLLLSQICQFTY